VHGKLLFSTNKISNCYILVLTQYLASNWQSDTISNWPTAYHVWHFAVTSFSLLQQLCTVGHTIFTWMMWTLSVRKLNNGNINRRVVFSKSAWVLHCGLLHSLLRQGDFWNPDISQCSVVTGLKCGGILKYGVIANLLLSLIMNFFLKILLNIWLDYGKQRSVVSVSECSSVHV